MEHTDVCFAPVLTMSEAAEHPHNVARDTFVERRRRQAAGAGAALLAAPWPSISSPPAHPGQHTREVLADWGIAEDRIDAARSPIKAVADSLMGTLVFFHAHPDDEAITTGGSMARASAEGHRVVLVVATNGDHGEVPDDLATARRWSTAAGSRPPVGRGARRAPRRVARLPRQRHDGLGAERRCRVVLLAPIDEAAERLAAVLREEHADVLDDLRLARQLRPPRPHPGPPRRPSRRRAGRHAGGVRGDDEPRHDRPVDAGGDSKPATTACQRTSIPNGPADDGNPFGTPEAEMTHAVDVSAYIDQKRAAITQPRQPGHRHRHVPGDARRDLRRGVRHRVVHQEGRTRRAARRLAVRMTRLYLVRHGRAAAGGTPMPIPASIDRAGTGRDRSPNSWPTPVRC